MSYPVRMIMIPINKINISNFRSIINSIAFLFFWISSAECGGLLTTTSGVITSPNYPNAYAHRRVCVWRIKVPRGRKIRLTFTDFALERSSPGGICRYDYVQVSVL